MVMNEFQFLAEDTKYVDKYDIDLDDLDEVITELRNSGMHLASQMLVDFMGEVEDNGTSIGEELI
jgi:hypothetical protein